MDEDPMMTSAEIDAFIDRTARQIVENARRTGENNLIASGLAGADLDRVLDLLADMDQDNYRLVREALAERLPIILGGFDA
jgi:hypothetical protein